MTLNRADETIDYAGHFVEELPMSDAMVASVAKDRAKLELHGRDPRLVVVIHVRFTILTLPE